MPAKNLMWIAWPAFLVAGILETIVFALFDPMDLHWLNEGSAVSRQGFYTLAFFLFWCVAALSSGLSLLLAKTEPGEGPMDSMQTK